MKTISIENDPIRILTPHGEIYIECCKWQEAKPEFVVTIHCFDDKSNLLLTVCDKTEEFEESEE